MKRYYSMAIAENEAEIYIFGDIIEPTMQDMCGIESDTSGYSLVQDLKALGDVDMVHVHINSYGGHVSEGLAIANTLKQHKARVVTYVDGFACSAAAGVFMAGDERIMSDASLLMIHNAWSLAIGNANQLRKEADDLDTITQATIALYMNKVNITEEQLKELMDSETWILPQDAREMGFATTITNDTSEDKASQSARKALFSLAVVAVNAEKSAHSMKDFTARLDDVLTEVREIKQRFDAHTDPAPADPPPTDQPPVENKTHKFITALFADRKDDDK